MAIKFKTIQNIQKYNRFRSEPFYNSKWTTKLITKLMKSGKRAVIEKKIFEVLAVIRNESESKNMAHYLIQYLYTIKPLMEIKLRRQWSRLVPVPFPLKIRHQLIKALSNLVYKIRENNGRKKLKLKTRILFELRNIQQGKSSPLALRRDEFYNKLIFAGRYIRYRWK